MRNDGIRNDVMTKGEYRNDVIRNDGMTKGLISRNQGMNKGYFSIFRISEPGRGLDESRHFSIGDAALAGNSADMGHRCAHLVNNPLCLGSAQQIIGCSSRQHL